jgi:uncharacterized protein YidB (DUF937 family)
MGLFDNLMGKVNAISGAAQMAQNAPALKDAVLEFSPRRRPRIGRPARGLQGQDLSGIASSWLSTGKNMPISAAQITQALGQRRFPSSPSARACTKTRWRRLTLVLP